MTGDTANEFSGQADAVVQAGTIHGGLHVYSSNSAKISIPQQLPMTPYGFVNRADIIKELNSLVSGRVGTQEHLSIKVSTLAGPPGVGKSALAIHWAHQVKQFFPDGSLFVDMQGYGPGSSVDPSLALDSFLRSLGISPDAIPITLSGRSSLFRSVVSDRRILVLIDNVNSSSQVRDLLPASSKSFVLVTSRSRLSGLGAREAALRMEVNPLRLEESNDLLIGLLGEQRVRLNMGAARQIAELCGHLPLALRVVADRAADRPEMDLNDLVLEVLNERNRLDALAVSEDELSDIRTIFSWSYRLLSDELKRLFRLLSLHPGVTYSLETVAAIANISVAEARTQLRGLVDVHLLDQPTPTRFQLHDLLRLYSQERLTAEDSRETRTKALRRVLGWYLASAEAARKSVLPFSPSVPLMPVSQNYTITYDSHEKAMRWFSGERQNLLAALDDSIAMGQYDFGWKFPIVSTTLWEVGWYASEWENVHLRGIEAAASVGEQLGEAVNTLLLGDAVWRQDRADEAAEKYAMALVLAQTLPEGWVRAFAMRGLGLLEQERGSVQTARRHFQGALTIFRQDQNVRGEAMSLLSLGNCSRLEEDFEDAERLGGEALILLAEIRDLWSVAWARVSIAETLKATGRYHEALAELKLSGSAFQGLADPKGELLALKPMAELYEHLRQYPEARECWRRIADLYEQIHDPGAEAARRRSIQLPGTE